MATSSILFGNFADAGDSIIPTLAGSKMRGYMRAFLVPHLTHPSTELKR
jgi:hypothetical protein